jgi:uncharacterized membrane protein YedE/YeeE
MPDALLALIFSPPKGVLLLLVGGVLIGFGTRYAGGVLLVMLFLV